LTRPLDGDFELSFDLISADADYDGSDAACSLYFGLGAESDFLSEPSAGIFAELALARWCPARYWVQPYVLTGAGRRFETEGHSDQFFCPGDALVVPDEWRNFVLRRRENVVSVSTSVLGQCAPAEQSLMYAGAMPALSSLRFGFGGNGFGVCPEGVGAGTIRNVELRLPDDPAECPEGRMLCTVDDAEPSCIDLRSSSEHCGACGRACASEESCVNGRCACSDASGFLVCDGACVDSSSSREHCGSCERSCEERCVNGRCDLLGTCASPLELAAAGGSFSLVFTGDPELSLAYCDPNAQSYWAVDFSVLRWTPDTTGTAIIEVGGDPELVTLLTITSVPDAACSYWATCGYVKRLDAFVSAGTPYLLGIGANPNGTFGRAEVRIRVAP
jgi:hypothetical protein